MKKPERFRAVLGDKINHAQERIYQPEIHLAAEWARPLDRARLKRAMRLVIDAEPVLGCRFCDSRFRPFWERLDEKALDGAEILREFSGPESGAEAACQAFYADVRNPAAGPQLAAFVAPLPGGGERLILKISHLSCDAGGVKSVFYRLGEIYSALAFDPGHVPAPALGSRSLAQVYLRFPAREWPAIFWSGIKTVYRMLSPLRSQQFPSGMTEEPPLSMDYRHFPRDRVSRMAACARIHGATLNDLMTAAVFRAVVKLSGGNVRHRLRLVSTVDLRRYLPGRKTGALCQVSGLYTVQIPYREGESFATTLASVKRSIDPQKEDYFGLGMMLVIRLAGLGQPYFIPKRIMGAVYRLGVRDGNLPPGFTNMGPVDKERCGLWGRAPRAVYLGVPTTRPPWFVVGLSGYDGTLSASSGHYPSAVPKKTVERLFDAIEEALDEAERQE